MSVTYRDKDVQPERAVHKALDAYFARTRVAEQNLRASESESDALDKLGFINGARGRVSGLPAADYEQKQDLKRRKVIRVRCLIACAIALFVGMEAGWLYRGSLEPLPVTVMALSPGAGGQEFPTSEKVVLAPSNPTSFTTPDIASPEVPAPTFSLYRITHYGPPLFPATNQVARGGTVSMWLQLAYDRGYDGICAVSPGTPWYDRVRDDMPPLLNVQGHGVYLAVDRMAAWIQGTVDIYEVDQQGAMYAHDKIVVEMEEENDEYNHTN
jgi:hypothetical protein